MKRIKPEELAKNLTLEDIANMVNEIPQSEEWHQIFELLSREDFGKVASRRGTEITLKSDKAMDSRSVKFFVL